MMISHRLVNHRVRKKLVAGVGFEPTTSGLCIPLQFSLPGLTSLWSGLSLHPRPNR